MEKDRAPLPFRIGQGWDVHQLAEGRKLLLGGVEIAHDKGLLGHSDADVLLHAITDALIGALGLGDIGGHFPDTSADFKNADSWQLLQRVADQQRRDQDRGHASCPNRRRRPDRSARHRRCGPAGRAPAM